MLVIEPARPDRDIALGGHPVLPRPIAKVQAHRVSTARHKVVAVGRRPAGLTRHASLVADPTDVRARVAEEDAVGLEVAHELPGRRPVVVRAIVDPAPLVRAAVIAVAYERRGIDNRTYYDWPTTWQLV